MHLPLGSWARGKELEIPEGTARYLADSRAAQAVKVVAEGVEAYAFAAHVGPKKLELGRRLELRL